MWYRKMQCALRLSLAKMRIVWGTVDISVRTLTSYWIGDVESKKLPVINSRNKITWYMFWTII